MKSLPFNSVCKVKAHDIHVHCFLLFSGYLNKKVTDVSTQEVSTVSLEGRSSAQGSGEKTWKVLVLFPACEMEGNGSCQCDRA